MSSAMNPAVPLINTDMIMDQQYGIGRPSATLLEKNKYCIMDRQYGIGRPSATLLEKNKYCINSLQHMATKCELDKRGILLFPKVIHGHTHLEYISSRSCSGLLLN